MTRTHRKDALLNILLLLCLAGIWVAFAPVKLGGRVAYIMVNGVSMEPVFRGGDLVLVREAETYQVGDIVSYYDPDMHVYVIHRIIAAAGGRYTLQGDNNTWVDSYHPTGAEIVGKSWIHLPKMGVAVQWLRVPMNLALTAALLVGGFLMLDMTLQPSNQPAGRKRLSARGSSGTFESVLYALGILGLVSLVLALFAFSRPILRAADGIPYEHKGTFYYSASGTPGVYDTDAVRSGEPIFLNLTCNLNLGFTYELTAEQLENVSGYQQFYAIVMDEQSGWQRTLLLTSDTNFTGTTYTSTAALDLCQVEELVAAVEQETGVRPSTYRLDVVARVSVGGTMSGQAFSDVFEPHLAFRFDKLHFYLDTSSAQPDPLQTTSAMTLSNPGQVDNNLNLLGLKPSVRIARTLSVLGLSVSVLGLLMLGLFYYAVSHQNQAAAIRIKYGALLVDVHDRSLETISPVIDVASIDDLAKLAERQNSMILHLARESMHTYVVQTDSSAYRYVTGKSRN